jgi:DNA-binding response OmpR family regulator
MKQKLSKTEERIFQRLVQGQGKTISYRDLFSETLAPLKNIMLDSFLENDKLKKKYLNVLSQFIFRIKKKTGEKNIKSISNIGYVLKKLDKNL